MVSKRYSDFDAAIKMAVKYLGQADNVTRLGLNQTIYEEFVERLDEWSKLLAEYKDTATRTTQITNTIRTVYYNFTSRYNHLKRSVKNNIIVALTDADYTNLSLHRDQKQHQIKPPTEVPLLTKLKTEHLYDQFEISGARVGAFKRRGLPKEVDGANIYYFIAADARHDRPAAAVYQILKRTSAATFRVEFKAADEGKRVFMKVCYVNRKSQEGPFSEVLDFVIS